MPWKKPVVQALPISLTSVLHSRHIISVQTPTSPTWRKTAETVWTAESAQAFAQMASGGRERNEDDPLHDPAGPWDYGDQYYPDHVLRYYHITDES